MHVASQAMGLGSIDVHGLGININLNHVILFRKYYFNTMNNVIVTDAESYFEVISALSHNLPPTLLVHGTALTVTAQLWLKTSLFVYSA